MKTWLFRQLNRRRVRHAPRRRDADLPESVLLVAGLCLLVPVAVFIYLRQKRNLPTVPTGMRIALSATRVLILMLLVFVLGSPFLKLDHESEKKPIVAVLFDHSQSMSLPAGPYDSNKELAAIAKAAGYRAEGSTTDAQTRLALNRTSRAKLAQTVVQNGAKGFFEGLTKKYDVQYWGFDRGMTHSASIPPSSASPSRPRPAAARRRSATPSARSSTRPPAGRSPASSCSATARTTAAGRPARPPPPPAQPNRPSSRCPSARRSASRTWPSSMSSPRRPSPSRTPSASP